MQVYLVLITFICFDVKTSQGNEPAMMNSSGITLIDDDEQYNGELLRQKREITINKLFSFKGTLPMVGEIINIMVKIFETFDYPNEVNAKVPFNATIIVPEESIKPIRNSGAHAIHGKFQATTVCTFLSTITLFNMVGNIISTIFPSNGDLVLTATGNVKLPFILQSNSRLSLNLTNISVILKVTGKDNSELICFTLQLIPYPKSQSDLLVKI